MRGRGVSGFTLAHHFEDYVPVRRLGVPGGRGLPRDLQDGFSAEVVVDRADGIRGPGAGDLRRIVIEDVSDDGRQVGGGKRLDLLGDGWRHLAFLPCMKLMRGDLTKPRVRTVGVCAGDTNTPGCVSLSGANSILLWSA